MRAALLFGLISLAATVSAGAGDKHWSVFHDEGVSLEYGELDNSILVVSCAPAEGETGKIDTFIAIPIGPGVKPRAQPIVLDVVEQSGTTSKVALKADVCGGEQICADRPSGDVSAYVLNQTGMDLALEIANKATNLVIDAPGAQISAAADRNKFAEFADLCGKL